MPTAISSPEWLKGAHSELWEFASRDVEGLFRSVDLRNPKRARDRLLVEVPQLTTAYGEQAALLAADWYDELRYLERVPGRYRARMADPMPEAFVRKRIRYGASHLFTGSPDGMLPFLLDATQKYVLQPGRLTIQRSSIRDPYASGWMRVTSPGACDFCLMLAGRGGVYKRSTATFAAHGNCNCSAAPSWDPTAKEVPVEAYEASEQLEGLRERAALGDKSAQEQLDEHRERVREYVKQMN